MCVSPKGLKSDVVVTDLCWSPQHHFFKPLGYSKEKIHFVCRNIKIGFQGPLPTAYKGSTINHLGRAWFELKKIVRSISHL